MRVDVKAHYIGKEPVCEICYKPVKEGENAILVIMGHAAYDRPSEEMAVVIGIETLTHRDCKIMKREIGGTGR